MDRGNLAKQTEDEFATFEPPDDPRKFPTLYTVQRLKTNSINPAAEVEADLDAKLKAAQSLRQAILRHAEAAFGAVWDNTEDAEYDRL